MDNLSEYIPAIVIIGLVLISLVRGGKKAKEEMAKTTLPGKSAREIIIKKTNNQPSVVNKKKESIVTLQNQSETHIKKGTIPTFAPSSLSSIDVVLSEETEQQSTPFLNVEDSDEIKQAFIYSEILNRKEY
jgi:hypothetical protein